MSNDAKEVKRDWFDVYDQVQKFYSLNNENYFKRTQILMVVIQSALFLGLINVFGTSNFSMKRASIFIISFLGILASYAWKEMIERQRQRLELCRYYMRFIESKLNIPLDFCTYEKKVFHDHSKKGDNKDLQLGDEKFPSVFKKRIRRAVFRIELMIA